MANPFRHIELGTTDLAKAKKFYKGLFQWKLNPFEGGYTLIDTGDKNVGGGMMQNEGAAQPSMWMPYVEVDDVKKAVAKARKLGAGVVVEYMEIPEGMGSFGVVQDPTGAHIGVWANAAKPQKAKSAKAKSKKKTK